MNIIIALAIGAVTSAVLVVGGVNAASPNPEPVSTTKLYSYGQ